MKWKRTEIHKLQDVIFFRLNRYKNYYQIVPSKCLFSVSGLNILWTSIAAADHGGDLLHRPSFEKLSSWEFYKISPFCIIYLFPWLQSQVGIKIGLFFPFSCFHLLMCGLLVGDESLTSERHLWNHPHFSLGGKITTILLTRPVCHLTGSVLITSAGEPMPVWN